MNVFVAILCGLGLASLVVGILLRYREKERSLAEILDLPFGERDVPVTAVTETMGVPRSADAGHGPLVEGTVDLAGKVVAQFDAKGTLTQSLERAQIPLRAGEFVLMAAAAGAVAAVVVAVATGQALFGLFALVVAPFAATGFVRAKVRRRRRAFEAQLPEALSLIASSLSAGHTFLRSIQMMCEECEPPLAEEFARVVSETRLGDSLVDALSRMAQRLQISDLDWVVQAIRIQQTVGGKLADVLHTLADYIRAREELRREVSVLTAEGRLSAWVLGALPVVLLFALQVMSPGYLAPMLQGWGLAWLVGCAVSVMCGVMFILRMVKIEV